MNYSQQPDTRVFLICSGILILFPLIGITQNVDVDKKNASSYNDLAWELRNKDPEQARKYGLLAIEMAREEKNELEWMKGLSFTGVACRNMGSYTEAMTHFSNGLEMALKTGNKEQQCYAYINLANFYFYLEKPNMSIEQLQKIEHQVVEVGNRNIQGYYHLNLGRAYFRLGNNEKAIEELNRSLEIRKQTGNKGGMGVCKQYLGSIYLKMGDFQSAKVNYKGALDFIDKEADKDLLSGVLNGLARSQLHSDIKRAKSNALESLIAAREIQSIYRLKNVSETLSEIAKLEGHFLLAHQYLEDAINFASQLYTEDLRTQTKQNELIIENFELEQEAQKLLSKSEANVQRLVSYSFGLAALFSCILTVLFIRRKSALKKTSQKIIRQEVTRQVAAQTREMTRERHAFLELDQHKEKLTEMVAHDLKNQLTIILNAASSNGVASYLENIHATALGMKYLLNNVVDIQHLRGVNNQLDLKPVPMYALVQSAKDQLQLFIDRKEAQVKIMVEDWVSLMVDKSLITRVFLNLLYNAIKYIPARGIIEVTCERTATSRIKIGVYDNGVGIKEGDLAFIFDTYWKGSSEGSGLGLSFCKYAIEAHGGKISAQSHPDRGTQIFFDLELAPAPASAKVTKVVKQINWLSVSEAIQLSPIVSQLKSIPIYDVGAILELIEGVDSDSEYYKKWRDELVQACYSWDEKVYGELLLSVESLCAKV